MKMPAPYQGFPYRAKFLLSVLIISIPLTIAFGVYYIQIGKTLTGAGILIFPVTGTLFSLYLIKNPGDHHKLNDFLALIVLFVSSSSSLTNFSDISSIVWVTTHTMCMFFAVGFKKGIRWNAVLISVFISSYYIHPFYADIPNVPFPIVINIILATLFATSIMAFFVYQVEANEKKLEKYANFDALTRIYNRRFITKAIEHLSDKNRRSAGNDSFSLILLDIDNFKQINDTLGHNVGDEVLNRIASILNQQLRKEDIAARWGGEEFLLLLRRTNVEQAYLVAEKIRQIISGTNFIHNIKVTVSVGIVEKNESDSIRALIHRVDAMLYYSKRKGKNCSTICRYIPDNENCHQCDSVKYEYCQDFLTKLEPERLAFRES